MILHRSEALVGLDVGSGAIRAVGLRRTSRGRGVTAIGREALPDGSIVAGDIANPRAVAEAIRRTLDRSGARTRRVAAAVSGNAVIVKRVTLPLMDEDDLAGSIRWEAEQYIPFDVRDVSLDYQVLQAGGDAANRASMDVLLVAAKKDKVAAWAEVIAQADGVPVVIDVAAFALQNAFEVNYGVEPGRVTMLVNAGAGGMNINVVKDGRTLLTRDVSPGGDGCAEVPPPEPGLSFRGAAVEAGLPGDGATPEVADPVTGAMDEHRLLEIEKTFDFFRTTTAAARVDELMVSGGAAGPAFLQAIETRIGVPVSPLDPFRRVRCDLEGWGEDGRGETDSTFAVAVGLALRRGDDR